jgi:multisubunit Na+/H+ antiporter MnhB subunit
MSDPLLGPHVYKTGKGEKDSMECLLMECLLAVFLIAVGLGIAALIATVYFLWEGWVLSVMWKWFAVPLFGLPRLNIGECIGIAMICSLLTHQYQPTPKDQKSADRWTAVLRLFVTGGIVLLVGWIVKR